MPQQLLRSGWGRALILLPLRPCQGSVLLSLPLQLRSLHVSDTLLLQARPAQTIPSGSQGAFLPWGCVALRQRGRRAARPIERRGLFMKRATSMAWKHRALQGQMEPLHTPIALLTLPQFGPFWQPEGKSCS